MKRGAIVLSYEYLAASLHLPDGHKVVAIVPQDAADVATGRVQIIVEGPQMYDLLEGDTPIRMTLVRDGLGRTSFAP